MRQNVPHSRRAPLAASLVLALLVLISGPARAFRVQSEGELGTPSQHVLTPKTIDRLPDPVLVQGALLHAAIGLPIEGMRLYAHRKGTFGPIPFDLNERDEEGMYILPSGPDPGKGTGKVAGNSELAYLAEDTGDRVSAEVFPKGWTRGFEIETTDPLNGRKGWAYLFSFPSNAPPKSSADYASLIEVKEPDPLTKKPYVILKGRYFQVRNSEGSTSWYDFHGTKEAGYEEKSFSDHVSVRSSLRIAGLIPFHADEESIYTETPAFYDGAVRLIRRVKLKIVVGKIKVPTGIVYDVTAYDRISTVPAKVKIPAAVKAISRSAWASYGLDLNPDAAGKYTYYSSQHPDGIPITGADPQRSFDFDHKELVPSRQFWSVVTGPYGTIIRRHITPPELEKRGLRHYATFVDDQKREYAPEYYKGQVGNVLTWLEVQNAPYGETQLDTYWYTPPHFKYPDDLPAYLNVVDHPISSKATEIAPKP